MFHPNDSAARMTASTCLPEVSLASKSAPDKYGLIASGLCTNRSENKGSVYHTLNSGVSNFSAGEFSRFEYK